MLMRAHVRVAVLVLLLSGFSPTTITAANKDGDGSVAIDGELKTWHKVTLTLDGPYATETDGAPNPFTDYRLTVVFRHESGEPEYRVPGYFAADGNAAETSAEAGTKWRAHLSPDKPGNWTYRVLLLRGKHAAVDRQAKTDAVKPYDGTSGSFEISESDKRGRDFRGKGRLEYVGGHYLRFAGNREYFLKAGPDAPETLLAYADFDGTTAAKKTAPLKRYKAHEKDWRDGNPSWKDGKGRGLIGALNYLSWKGCNAFSFLTYNAGGDGDNVWPMIRRGDKLHYDCSKLDQWQIVFDHAQSRGLYLHFKMQETENDDTRRGLLQRRGGVSAALDGGDLGVERKLYCRELVARFAHELALNWNLGEENTQSARQQRAMAQYLRYLDPYDHHIVVHTYPNQQDKVYLNLLGDKSVLTGASLQNSWSQAHQRTLHWVTASAEAGKPWVVCNDEQNPASQGVPPDPAYQGHSGKAEQGGKPYNLHDIRKYCLWGTLTAGGAGVEYYFGYGLPQNDLLCEDFRSRDRSWDYCRIAIDFFHERGIPFWEMTCADELVGNPKHDNLRYCFSKRGEIYLIYLPTGGTSQLDLSGASGQFHVAWFNPRTGGALSTGSVKTVEGSGNVSLGKPPRDEEEDWLIVVRR
jgi:hypothetical protein